MQNKEISGRYSKAITDVSTALKLPLSTTRGQCESMIESPQAPQERVELFTHCSPHVYCLLSPHFSHYHNRSAVILLYNGAVKDLG